MFIRTNNRIENIFLEYDHYDLVDELKTWDDD